jgi:hypothetical protein
MDCSFQPGRRGSSLELEVKTSPSVRYHAGQTEDADDAAQEAQLGQGKDEHTRAL